jgi:hypothetical protein
MHDVGCLDWVFFAFLVRRISFLLVYPNSMPLFILAAPFFFLLLLSRAFGLELFTHVCIRRRGVITSWDLGGYPPYPCIRLVATFFGILLLLLFN